MKALAAAIQGKEAQGYKLFATGRGLISEAPQSALGMALRRAYRNGHTDVCYVAGARAGVNKNDGWQWAVMVKKGAY